MEPCSCLHAGWCQRHQMQKDAHLFAICNRSDGYALKVRAIWDKIPLTVEPQQPPPPAKEQIGEFRSTDQDLPSLVKQAKNAAVAGVRYAAGGFANVDDAVYEARLAVCHKCTEKYIPESKRCAACGCYVEIKARMASEDCPLGKWPEQRAQHAQPGCGGCGS